MRARVRVRVRVGEVGWGAGVGAGGGGAGSAHDELAPTLAARLAMRRRSTTFLDADALRSETLHERAAKQEADMLREQISEQDTTNASLRERNAPINAQLRALAIEGAGVQ